MAGEHDSTETTAWIAAQNALTRTVLAGAGDAERAALTQLVTNLADYPKYGVLSSAAVAGPVP